MQGKIYVKHKICKFGINWFSTFENMGGRNWQYFVAVNNTLFRATFLATQYTTMCINYNTSMYLNVSRNG